MGICYGKNFPMEEPEQDGAAAVSNKKKKTECADRNIGANFKAASVGDSDKSAFRAASSALFQAPPFRQAASLSFYSAASLTPECSFKQSLPPPSPVKASQEDVEKEKPSPLNGNQLEKPTKKSFGYPKNFSSKYELQQEIGRGQFGHTMVAKLKKGSLKGLFAAVKIIPKSKMETNVAIEDVKREVKILKALTGHHNLVQFYDACEDNLNVYIITELCEGGELLHRILSRGGKYPEEDAKTLVAQILDTVAFCHLQGVVHRDLKPENFLFKNKDEKSELKAIDFGLSDFIRPDERLNDIVGSPYYVAPEVLERSYSTEADVWSIGVITYVLLCGNRPFWARTESGIFGAVLKLEPDFEDTPWPSISSEAKDFVKRLLNKDQHKRMTAAQALSHPWICGIREIPLDILVYRLVKAYLQSSNLRKSALKALSKTLNEDDMIYLRAQFKILDPQNGNQISLENFRLALTRNATEAMKESRMIDILAFMEALESQKIDFEEFCAAAISVPQLQGREHWEKQVLNAYEGFEKAGNRSVAIEELAQELGIPPACVVLEDWVRPNDGRISFSGFANLLCGNPPLLMLPLDSPLD